MSEPVDLPSEYRLRDKRFRASCEVGIKSYTRYIAHRVLRGITRPRTAAGLVFGVRGSPKIILSPSLVVVATRPFAGNPPESSWTFGPLPRHNPLSFSRFPKNRLHMNPVRLVSRMINSARRQPGLFGRVALGATDGFFMHQSCPLCVAK